MEVLVVSPVVPFPGIPHAGGQFLLRHLERLRPGPVTLLSLDLPENRVDPASVPDWLTLVLAPIEPPARGSLQHQRDRVTHRLRGTSLLPHNWRAMLRSGLVERARAADLIELQWPELAHLAPFLKRVGVTAPVVTVEHDVAADAARGAVHSDHVDRLSALALRPLHRARERQSLQAADLVLVFKAADEQLLRRLGVTTDVHVLDPWLDPPAASYDERDPRAVLFTGAFTRPENERGAHWLLDRVWPQVRLRVPDATLVLAGAGPSAGLRAAAERSGAEVTGRMPDLTPAYQRASVFAAPLFTGGGLKFKVPQAMVHRMPVVTTAFGAAGLEGAPEGALWAVTEDPAAFADGLVRALLEPRAAQAAGLRAAAWVQERFSFERSGEQVRRRYAELVDAASLRTAAAHRPADR